MSLRTQLPGLMRQLGHPATAVACLILLFMTVIALTAPWLHTIDPTMINPAARLQPPSAEHWFGTDPFGRDIYSRVIYGARISLIVGLGAALISLFFGLIKIGRASCRERVSDSVAEVVML